ncbi:hypothetical protein GCM10029992_66970 [Glycomyces albus]
MGMDPGPDVPLLPGQARAGSLKEPVSAEVEGQTYTGSPSPTEDNRHYYPGGNVDGRPVPTGWYNTPWWKPALAGVGGALVGMMVIDAMLMPAYAGAWSRAPRTPAPTPVVMPAATQARGRRRLGRRYGRRYGRRHGR